jgi:Tfp pilus assembly protein PilV
MRTFFEMTSKTRRNHGHRLAAAISARLHACDPRRQDGFLLIEVMISALLVALIVTATFNGLDVATRITADQRHHDQAGLLAAQSQEQLRTEPASALDLLETNPHKYTTKIGGTTYTITQEAKAVSASGNTTGCNATESTAQTGANILITSKVGWPQQAAAKRPEVKQASVISPPTGSALEVDVLNGEGGGVAGVTARAKFIPNEAGSYNTVEGTTSIAGCVVLTGIQATKATVEIVEKAGFVAPNGALSIKPKELTIAPNVTTHYAVKYAEAGRIAAQFTYEGATMFGGKAVQSDSFVAFNSETGVKPEYETGSSSFQYKTVAPEAAEEFYRALTGTYAPISYTAAGSKYSLGRLFPFKAGWTVWAGDCLANNVVGTEDEVGGVVVKSGSTTTVNVPMSYTKLSIYTGVSSGLEPGELTKENVKGGVKVTNNSCAGAEEPLNAYSPIYTHEQKETLPEGRLENPFQPFGSFALCVADSAHEKTYTVNFTNSKASGSTPAIFLKQKTAAEKAFEISQAAEAKAKRKTEETEAATAKTKREGEETAAATAKTKREGEETAAATAKTKREGEETAMAAARATRLTKEAEERATWKKQEEKKEISKSTREAKEATQTTARKTKETEETTAKTKREGEETAAATAKTKREGEETAAAIAKTKRGNEETEAAAAKTKRGNEETAATAAEAVRKTRETAEATNGVTVEGKVSC